MPLPLSRPHECRARHRRRTLTATGRRAFPVMLLALLAALILAILPMLPARAQATPAAPPGGDALRVVIKPLAPFVSSDGDDTYYGFSIDLWQEIARRTEHPFAYVWVETVTEQLQAVEQGRGDLAITGISITREREEQLDFSLPYFEAGLQIMTSADNGNLWQSSLGTLSGLLLSGDVFLLLAELALVIVIVAHLFWLLERGRNSDFPRPYLRGVWEGIWYAVVTLVTVGYGDRTAKSVPGRIVAMLWMFTGLLIVANFTANLTSRITISQIQGSISSYQDLPGKRVATVGGSTAADFLDAQRIDFVASRTIEEAYALLEKNEADAIVFDSPVLLHHALNEGNGQVQLVGGIFEPQDYGIAFEPGSPLREPVNRALLELVEDGTYEAIYMRWFGAAP
ncbi:MAG: transporter substrate-binding domain-containing protein [Caldilineaceae bacterium]